MMRWWRRQDREQDLERELRSHLEQEAVERREAGLSEEAAHYAARRAFGNAARVQEEVRAMWGWTFVDRLRQDVRYAARTLRRSPAFTSVVLLALALGMGANTAVFSVVNGVLLRPLPYRSPDRLMILDEKWLPRFPHFEATPTDFLSWREQSHSFEQVAAFLDIAFNVTGENGPERILGARVSANLPALLGVAPILGRSFTPEEDVAGNDHVVLLGYGLWQRRFGSDPQVAGKTLRLGGGAEFTVVGVMPPGFHFPDEAEIWKPMGFTAADLKGGHFIYGIGRLRPGVTRAQAQAEMDLIMPRLQQPQVWSANVIPALEYYVGEVRTALYVLLGAAGLVLLIACVNVASLLLARGSARHKEMSLRTSLGASRGRVVQQLLTESLLLALGGGALGLLLATAGISAVKRLSVTSIPRLDQVAVDYGVLLFTLAISLLTGVLFGLIPGLRLSHGDLQSGLKAGGRISETGLHSGARSVLVISEVALALALLAGAGLLLKSFRKLLDVRPGFHPENVVAATINLPASRYRESSRQVRFVQTLLERVGSLPGVRQAAVTAGLPFSSVSDAGIRIDGRPVGTPESGAPANDYRVTPGYFQAMGIPLLRGRLLAEGDGATGPPVVLINETMAKRFFAHEDPIGKRVDISGPTYLREIVGVVGDVKQSGLKGSVPPQVYESYFQKPANSFVLVVRSSGNPLQLAEAFRHEVLALDKDQPVSSIRTMNELVAASLAHDRFSTFLLGLFAMLALVLAAVGIYGVIAYSVTQRTHEIGIRMALGARPSGILGLVLAQSLRVVAIGAVLGVGASLLLTRLLASLLFEVKANDPVILAAVSGLLLSVAVAAAFLPARRASRVDPMIALRCE
ncbi:Macrolide transporter ATP-binding /permease protein [Candidatus Sulfopaludibacter sp. SbA3]|nr:Macrolide transporter ATP-binding /permease protein [Candidatus Sulfopaludibacter sp. SbA3]